MRKGTGRLILLVLMTFSFATPCLSEIPQEDMPLVLMTDFAYGVGDRESLNKARALALFGARMKSVVSAAERFKQEGLLKNYGAQAPEIFCLAATKINARIVSEAYTEKNKQYAVTIKAEVDIADFIKAEIENQSLDKAESGFRWKEEMEQPVSESIDPGTELSRAYRYIRKDQTRIAIIYLDHLVQKYPHWGDAYYLRALGFRLMHSEDQMLRDLEKACALNHQAACAELRD